MTVTDNVTKQAEEGAPDQHWTSVHTACPPDTSVNIKHNLLKSLQSATLTMLNIYLSADRPDGPLCITAREAWAYSVYFGPQQQSTATYMHTTADAHAHTYAHTQNNQKWHIHYKICKTSQNVQDMHQ